MNECARNEDRWTDRWSQLARAAGLSPSEPIALALSGGADSVFLLHVLAQASPRPKLLAIHVDHGLRGGESEEDAAFCARLCAKLSVPFARRRVELDPGANLEARAREARYRALADEARAAGLRTIVTGHHEDDVLETLLQRWMRGTDLPGLAGLRSRNVLGAGQDALQVVRPLRSMRREEVRRLLRDAGLAWREDSSNADPRFTRNRVRGGLLPEVERACGPEGLERLRDFAGAVERLEEELAGRTAHLAWDRPDHAPAVRSAQSPASGTLERGPLRNLAAPLQRRALWRLLSEGTGHPPSRALLGTLQEDLAAERTTRRSLPGGWTLHLRREDLLLTPPSGEPWAQDAGAPEQPTAERGGPHSAPRAAELPRADGFPRADGGRAPARDAGAPLPAPETGPPGGPLRLDLPGQVCLPDGRALAATLECPEPGAPVPREATVVELDATDLEGPLEVRSIRPGDRFHPLGAPGSRPLGRFLRDAGIPAAERPGVVVVARGSEILWVAGVRPGEPRRVRSGTTRRLRLSLLDTART